jgi:hypothetical protein
MISEREHEPEGLGQVCSRPVTTASQMIRPASTTRMRDYGPDLARVVAILPRNETCVVLHVPALRSYYTG